MSDQEYAIRTFQEEDLGEWFRLRQLLWDETPDDDHQGEMMDIIEHSDSQFVSVADLGDGRLAGFLEASIRPFVDDCSSENVGYLEGWFVDPEFRRQGIGRKLVASAEKWAALTWLHRDGFRCGAWKRSQCCSPRQPRL